MSEIKVGEWIRTKNGQIDTFEETDENYMFARCKKKTYWKLDIVNHSKDIIDLIQKDDYVNGCRVYEVEEKGKHFLVVRAFIPGARSITVVDAATIVGDAIESMVRESGEKNTLFHRDHPKAISELNNMYVTSKDIDETVKRLSFTISEAINIALQIA